MTGCKEKYDMLQYDGNQAAKLNLIKFPLEMKIDFDALHCLDVILAIFKSNVDFCQ